MTKDEKQEDRKEEVICPYCNQDITIHRAHDKRGRFEERCPECGEVFLL